MRHTSHSGIFPWLTVFSGILGFALQFWLLSSRDAKGLLPHNHIAGILSFLLLAFTLAAIFLLLRKSRFSPHYERCFPRSVFAAAGSAAGALAMGYSVFTQPSMGLFRILMPVLGIISVCALLVLAYCQLKGLRPHYLFSCAVTFYFVIRNLLYCRHWGTEPQMVLYFFPLMASIFLLLTCYFRAELDAKAGNFRRYAFFNQAALFCCCLCVPGENGIFYLLCALWMAASGPQPQHN